MESKEECWTMLFGFSVPLKMSKPQLFQVSEATVVNKDITEPESAGETETFDECKLLLAPQWELQKSPHKPFSLVMSAIPPKSSLVQTWTWPITLQFPLEYLRRIPSVPRIRDSPRTHPWKYPSSYFRFCCCKI